MSAGETRPSPGWVFWSSLALVAANLLIYMPVAWHPFVGFDDPQYVAESPHVASGLTWAGVRWAFTSGEQGNWHPLTWLSHMLDVQLFGLDAGAHHLVSVALHIVNTLLLLTLLVTLTGARWRSAVVAALFAVHPMHVESVAWVAERKDVLSTAFWTAALLAYTAWVRRPAAARYVAIVALFAAGLMSKPMVVTLPFVLLLLDVWPLGRVQPGLRAAWGPLVREKLPLFALSAASAVVTFVVQQQSGAVRSIDALPVGRRIEMALAGYQTYASKLIWPRDLAVLYPYPESIPIWQVASAAMGLALVTVLAFRAVRKRPWFTVGWLWFAGTLVPVIGLVQVGSQPVADRYTYIPYTGLFIMFVWAAAELIGRRPGPARWAAATVVLVTIGVYGVSARQRVHDWRDGVTLWSRAIDVTERNYRAHSALGFALLGAGRTAEAVDQFNAALAINPRYPEALANLGVVRSDEGKLTAAASHLEAALVIDPDYVEALATLGLVRAREGRLDDAIALFERARLLRPRSADVRNGLGFAFALAGRLEEARAELAEAIRLSPRHADAHGNLGLVLGDMGDRAGAMASFRQALAHDPDHARSRYGLGALFDDAGRLEDAVVELAAAGRLDPALAEAHNRLGRVLAKLGRMEEALSAFGAAVRARPTEPDFHYDLGVMLLKAGRTTDAISRLEDARHLRPGHPGATAILRDLGRIR